MTTGGFDTVLDFLTGEILAGRVAPDSRLPNERELAAQLGASRSAVREAIKVLQAQGVITSNTGPGRGTRVAASQGAALGRMLGAKPGGMEVLCWEWAPAVKRRRKKTPAK